MSTPSSADAAIELRGRAPATASRRQQFRLACQMGFFILFVLAPVFDVFRYDLAANHAILFGHEWRLGLDDYFAGRITAADAGINILLRLFLPIFASAALFLAVAWRWGRLYCGWFCPHFSVVETINALMRRASGRPSLWDSKPLPEKNPDGRPFRVDARWWLATVPLALAFALLWAVVLLTYLLPPFEVYAHLFALAPTPNEAIFIAAATSVLTLEFLFARHLFCRFGCAVGLFQSLAWMTNRDALVVGFQRPRAVDCATCYAAASMGTAACEAVCPMRLRPRVPKHQMFTCTQCAQCVAACATVQQRQAGGTLLEWVDKAEARTNETHMSLTGKR